MIMEKSIIKLMLIIIVLLLILLWICKYIIIPKIDNIKTDTGRIYRNIEK